jgi:hypothetical protein
MFLPALLDQAAMFVLRAGEGERQAVAAAASGMFEPPRYWMDGGARQLVTGSRRLQTTRDIKSVVKTYKGLVDVYIVTVCLIRSDGSSVGRYP